MGTVDEEQVHQPIVVVVKNAYARNRRFGLETVRTGGVVQHKRDSALPSGVLKYDGPLNGRRFALRMDGRHPRNGKITGRHGRVEIYGETAFRQQKGRCNAESTTNQLAAS